MTIDQKDVLQRAVNKASDIIFGDLDDRHGCLALLCMLCFLQSPWSYKKRKIHPVGSIKELIDIVLLRCATVKRLFNKRTAEGKWAHLRGVKKYHLNDGKLTIMPNLLFDEFRSKYDFRDSKYDLSISYASCHRDIARKIRDAFRDTYYRKVFLDEENTVKLFGADLNDRLTKIYGEESDACVVLLSDEYISRRWTMIEMRAALSKAISHKKDYIFPIIVDSMDVTQIPPELSQFAYIPLSEGKEGIENLCKEINERVWQGLEENWFDQDDLAQAIYDTPLVDIFKSDVVEAIDKKDTARLLIGLICSSQLFLREEVIRFIARMLHDHDLLDKAFRKDIYLLRPPSTKVKRLYNSDIALYPDEEFFQPLKNYWSDDNNMDGCED